MVEFFFLLHFFFTSHHPVLFISLTCNSLFLSMPLFRRQDTCIKMNKNATASCKIELWMGNDHTAGSSETGTTYVFNQSDGSCTYSPSMVPAITHPDSFVDVFNTTIFGLIIFLVVYVTENMGGYNMFAIWLLLMSSLGVYIFKHMADRK